MITENGDIGLDNSLPPPITKKEKIFLLTITYSAMAIWTFICFGLPSITVVVTSTVVFGCAMCDWWELPSPDPSPIEEPPDTVQTERVSDDVFGMRIAGASFTACKRDEASWAAGVPENELVARRDQLSEALQFVDSRM